MIITAIRATRVRIPITRIAAYAKRVTEYMTATVVEVETDAGINGIGESRGEWSAAIINERFAPKLIGLAVDDRRAMTDFCLAKQPFDYGFPEFTCDRNAFAGIDMALWDILGKETGRPLYNLLGGACREHAPFVAYAYAVDPREGKSEAEVASTMAEIAAVNVAKTGATMFEFKVGLHSLACEIATVKAVRETIGPDVNIAVDANMGFTVEQARQFLTGVTEVRLANFEEPVSHLAGIARLREEFDVPVSTHCIDLDALSAHPAIDSVVSDLSLLGGIAPLLSFMNGVTALGKRFWLRARWESGIGWAAMCHLGLACPELDRPAQALIDWIEDDLILGQTWSVTEGGVRPPDKPGLGVELDRAALEKYAVSNDF
jgi:glucarate dehydratase